MRRSCTTIRYVLKNVHTIGVCALLHQAKTKAGDEAVAIYQDAIEKFAFCMLINPEYLGAAINGGVGLYGFGQA